MTRVNNPLRVHVIKFRKCLTKFMIFIALQSEKNVSIVEVTYIRAETLSIHKLQNVYTIRRGASKIPIQNRISQLKVSQLIIILR